MNEKEISEVVKELCKKGNIEYVFMTQECIYYSVTRNKILREVVNFIKKITSNIN